MPDLPRTSSPAPTLYQTIWVTTGRHMILDHHHLQAIRQGEGGGAEDGGGGREVQQQDGEGEKKTHIYQFP